MLCEVRGLAQIKANFKPVGSVHAHAYTRAIMHVQAGTSGAQVLVSGISGDSQNDEKQKQR